WRPSSGGEKLPALGTERDAAALAGGMIEGQVDLDAMAGSAQFELDAAGAADAAAGGDDARQGGIALDQFDIVGTEEQPRRALVVARGDADGPVTQPDIAP